MAKSNLKPHQRALLFAGLASAVIYALPVVRLALLPLTYLNTHIHEVCHALMATGTGGLVRNIEVYANGSGVTWTEGGIAFLTSTAGYVGAALTGFAMMLSSRTEAGTRLMLRGLAFVLGFAMLLWLRGDGVGLGSGVVWLGALVLASKSLSGQNLLFVGQFLGVQQCLNSISSVYELLKITAVSEAHSDARNMEVLTNVPAIFWAVIWSVVSVILLMQGLRLAWSAKPLVATSRS